MYLFTITNNVAIENVILKIFFQDFFIIIKLLVLKFKVLINYINLLVFYKQSIGLEIYKNTGSKESFKCMQSKGSILSKRNRGAFVSFVKV